LILFDLKETSEPVVLTGSLVSAGIAGCRCGESCRWGRSAPAVAT
jgi:hypothetical protein